MKPLSLNRVILILSLAIVQISFGQMDTNRVKNNLVLSFNPVPLMDFYHGNSANFGFEVRSSNKYSFYGEFGTYIYNPFLTNNYDQEGFTVSGELKRYFKYGKAYFSVQYMQGEHSYERSDIIGYGYNFDEYRTYKVNRTFRDFSFRWGGLYVFKNNFSFNPYLGLGLRFQNLESDLSDQAADERQFGYQYNPDKWLHNNGKSTYLKLHFGLRFGFKIF